MFYLVVVLLWNHPQILTKLTDMDTGLHCLITLHLIQTVFVNFLKQGPDSVIYKIVSADQS